MNGQTVRQAFANNRITAIKSCCILNPELLPDAEPTRACEQLLHGVKTPASQRWYAGRLDYTVSDSNRLYASLMEIPRTNVNSAAQCPMNCTNGSELDQSGQITDSWTLSPTVVNEARASILRESDTWNPPNLNQGYPAISGW